MKKWLLLIFSIVSLNCFAQLDNNSKSKDNNWSIDNGTNNALEFIERGTALSNKYILTTNNYQIIVGDVDIYGDLNVLGTETVSNLMVTNISVQLVWTNMNVQSNLTVGKNLIISNQLIIGETTNTSADIIKWNNTTNTVTNLQYQIDVETNRAIQFDIVNSNEIVILTTNKLSLIDNGVGLSNVNALTLDGYSAQQLAAGSLVYYIRGSSNGPVTVGVITTKIAQIASPATLSSWTTTVANVTNGKLLAAASIPETEQPFILPRGIGQTRLVLSRSGNAAARTIRGQVTIYENDMSTVFTNFIAGDLTTCPVDKDTADLYIDFCCDVQINTVPHRWIVFYLYAVDGWSGQDVSIYSQDSNLSRIILQGGNQSVYALQSSIYTNFTLTETTSNSVILSGQTANFFIKTNYSGGVGTITNMKSTDGSIVWTDSGGPEPDGSVTNYLKTQGYESNSISIVADTNIQFRTDGTTNYISAMPTNGLFYFNATHRIAVTSENFEIQYYNGVSWSNLAKYIP